MKALLVALVLCLGAFDARAEGDDRLFVSIGSHHFKRGADCEIDRRSNLGLGVIAQDGYLGFLYNDSSCNLNLFAGKLWERRYDRWRAGIIGGNAFGYETPLTPIVAGTLAYALTKEMAGRVSLIPGAGGIVLFSIERFF